MLHIKDGEQVFVTLLKTDMTKDNPTCELAPDMAKPGAQFYVRVTRWYKNEPRICNDGQWNWDARDFLVGDAIKEIINW